MSLSLVMLASALTGMVSDPPVVNVQKITVEEGAPVLDGNLNDPIWANADSVYDFTQLLPNPGEPARFGTVAHVAVSDGYVYVGVRAYDPEPAKIVGQLTRRDEESASDWIRVAFDSYHDRRTAYGFSVNPAGVEQDFIITGDSNMDDSWDAVWEVQTRIDSLGWTAEYRIPLAALRFSTEGDGIWGFQVVREVQRTVETSSWAPFRDDEPKVVSRFGELHGMTGLPAPRRLEILPYTVTGLTRAPGDVADPFYSSSDWGTSAGLDLKYGVTSNLTLDLTINPDFGQVEADPSEVNLSAYETFFPEKRPFFTEGADIFNFKLSAADGDNANEQLFYSRRIGRAPQGYPDAPDGSYVDVPGQTSILGAAKLSGQTSGGWSLGLLNAVTSTEHAQIRTGSSPLESAVVEPFTNYTVARLRKDLNGGSTQIGVVGTGVVRDLPEDTDLANLRSSAYSGGIDFSHRFSNDEWEINGSLLGSHVRGSAEAILRTQRSPARYFQRPDADHLQVDSAATSLSGWSAMYGISRIAGGNWRGGLIGQIRSPGFEVNDIGYLRDADQIFTIGYLGYRQIEPGRFLRSYNVNLNLFPMRNFGWENVGTGGNINGSFQLLNYWGGHGGIGHHFESLNTGALRGGPAINDPALTNGWFGMHSDQRKKLNFGLNGSWNIEDETDGYRIGLSPRLNWRPSTSTQVSLSPGYSQARNAWQYVGLKSDAAGADHYIFGTLDQQTFSLSARVSKTFSPGLGFQLYAQPFVSAGTYGGYMEAANPRGDAFEDRFDRFDASEITRNGDDLELRTGADEGSVVRLEDPSFNVRDFNLNAVLRWEYRPGSTLFFVWSHGRSSSEETGDFRPRHDLQELFAERSTNVFMIKANWWFTM